MEDARAKLSLHHRRYEAGALLGRGGQGFVLRVVDREAPRRALVAKVWRPGAFDESVAAGEFALLARLRAPGLVRAHDFARDERTGAPFFVEDFVDGVDATTYVQAAPEGPARNARLAGVLAGAASTLAALHDAGFVHGDLKPAHVRVDAEGRTSLLDLGAAVSHAQHGAGIALTRELAAPELLAGARPTPASDLHGLGALAWAAATSGAPRDRRDLRALAPWVQPSVADVVTALLSEHPADRPSEARDVLRRLGAATTTAASTLSRPTHAPAPQGRERELATLLRPASARVRYVVGASGAGKSQLVREVATRALLAGREARVVSFPCDDASFVARIIAYFRGAEEAWPFVGAERDACTPPLVVMDDLHAAPAEVVGALDAYRCRTSTARGPDVIATARVAPDGAESLALGPLDATDFAALCRALGVDDDDAIADAARASSGNPGWLVASQGRVPLARDVALDRARSLSSEARDLFASIAIAGGELSATTCEAIAPASAIAELLGAALLARRRNGDAMAYAMSTPSLATEIAAALATFELTDRLAEALLVEPNASATALLQTAESPTSPSRREDLLRVAASRARAGGLRSQEIDALFALAADPARRDGPLLFRLERLTRDAGTASTHPQVMTWLDEAAQRDPSLAPLALRRRAEQAARAGDGAKADALVAEAERAARALEDPVTLALVRSSAGSIALYRADWSAADVALRDARSRLASMAIDDVEELARLEHNFGVVALYRARTDEAIAAFEGAVRTKRRLGDRAGLRSGLLNLGLALARAQRFDEAEAALDEALALARSLHQQAGRAWCLAARADVSLKRGDASGAERWIGEGEALGDAAPAMVRADLALLRAEVARIRGDARASFEALRAIDPAVRDADAMIDARAWLGQAGAHLASLPSRRHDAARAAIAALRLARRAALVEVEALALDALRAARTRSGAFALAAPYAPPVTAADDGASTWSWLDSLGAGASADDAAAELARVVAAGSGAERAFVAMCDEEGAVTRAWGVDLDGLAIADAARRVDADVARAALASVEPIHQRDVATPGGRGSRIAIASRATRALVVAEHRFAPSRFDRVAAVDARRWATLAALVARLALGERRLPDAGASTAASERWASSVAIAQAHDDDRSTTSLPIREARRTFTGIVGVSPAMRKALARLDAAVDSDLPALIVGETGTGKELFARALHDHGVRARGPFVAVNCSAIPDALFEAELFGHARGSFTGADRARPGLIARAEGGTLLLDEIGELPLQRQATLLRALESRHFRPVGSDDERPFDVRVVAATNRDLDLAVDQGTFRRDLLYRLNVVEIRVPSLRERAEDVPLLARAFLDRAGSRAELAAEAIAALGAYAWPGNVRELEHLMQRLAASGVTQIGPEHLPRRARVSASKAPPPKRRERATEDEERAELRAALEGTRGNITLAARALGLTRQGLKKRMMRLGLRPPSASRAGRGSAS